MAIFIKDIYYLPMTGKRELKRGSIRIEGQHIIAMGNDIAPSWGDEVIQGRDKCALPGFVNCHTHAAMTLLRGVGEGLRLNEWLNGAIMPLEKKLTGEDIYWGTLLANLEMLKSGTTCYSDMYYDVESSLWAVKESGIRAVLGAGLTDTDGAGECRLEEAIAYCRRYQQSDDGRVRFMLAPHSVYSCSSQYLQDVEDASRKEEMRIHIHIAETRQEQDKAIVQTGRRVMKYLEYIGFLSDRVIGAHMIHLDKDELMLTKHYGVTPIHCPQSNMYLASGFFPYSKFKELGIPVALGTDGTASNNDLDMFEEMRTASLLAKAVSGDPQSLPSYEALKMATIEGARALGLDKEIGTLEVGKRADINIISLNSPHFYPRDPKHCLIGHLAYCAKAGDVDTVIVNGRVLVQKGKALYLDEEKICRQVQERAQKQ